MIIGAGPIVIGQACEFDYSGTQACKALRAEGYEVILINSNPATIMTDPETADRTYVGPMTFEALTDIVERERPDAILPTMGGQTGLNLAKGLAEMGVLDRLGIELIGAKLDSINVAEDRLLFKQAMEKIGLKCPPSGTANTLDEAIEIQKNLIGEFPVIIRPAFTLGGTGGGIAYNVDDFHRIVKAGLSASLTNQVLVEKSLLGWKEYELEVMRDLGDNQVIICSIENVDPMGVHTGDSITIAPSQTLTDKEYQRLRDASLAIMRIVGVECGGSNVQFGINPVDGEVMVIEMNPRVSRSSALASKATGFPIAKFAAKLACGTSLDRIPNDITKATPASFEPSIDYIVTKIPRFTFEKFPGAEPVLTTQMKSVGEAMAFGRTFIESFQKAMRSTELGYDGMSVPKKFTLPTDEETIAYNLRTPNPDRMIYIAKALELGWTEKKIVDLTKMDPWFVNQFAEVAKVEKWLRSCKLEELTAEDFREVKSRGCSDEQIAKCLGVDAWAVRKARKDLGVVPVYKRVDTCAAEFEANTPYQYSTYHEGECEANPTEARKVMILGGGPNRIGQGIEFDYCCCHAAFALRKAGFETIMVNCNPETVSTDYDTSDRLYFEPMTAEDVLNIIEKERPEGIVVQFGGQTPLKLCTEIQKYLDANPIPNAAGTGDVKIWGTQPSSIDEAEDRDLWYQLLTRLEIRQPPGSTAASEEEAVKKANEVGYPVMVRPSYVLGGRGMVTVFSDDELKKYVRTSALVEPDKPLLVDKYLDRATELDVDALCDKDGNVTICGIMEHIEMAGVHSGDSACSIPTQTVSEEALSQMREWTVKLAKALKVVGLINIQYVVQDGVPYIIEANPRASRTVPFVAKAIGHPIAKYASLLMAGKTLEDLGFTEEPVPPHVSVKEVVLPFEKFAGADVLLGPEMRSTGEVMGIDPEFSIAYLKASLAAGQRLPLEGNVFMSVNDESKEFLVPVARVLSEMGYNIVATSGTAERFEAEGIPVKKVLKVHEGRPNIMDAITNEEINLAIIMSTGDKYDLEDGKAIRRLALGFKVPIVTTVAGAVATAGALKALKSGKVEHKALQDYNPSLAPDFV
ncbi:unnamed protein product [Pedinophyceae sp. YPF-701]|nr:unnamed protein product [Pedinophyceae sp. YPF-701]